MALIICKKCGKKYSEFAECCPSCGCQKGAPLIECQDCGNKFRETDELCPNCGCPKGVSLVECRECGNKFRKSDEFCPNCGCPMEKQIADQEATGKLYDQFYLAENDKLKEIEQKIITNLPYKKKKQKKTIRIIFSIIFLASGIVSIIYPIARKDYITFHALFDWWYVSIESPDENIVARTRLYDDCIFEGYLPVLSEDYKQLYATVLHKQVVLRQLPFFVLGVLSLIVSFLSYKSSKKYVLIIDNTKL